MHCVFHVSTVAWVAVVLCVLCGGFRRQRFHFMAKCVSVDVKVSGKR